jgi:hypothetical protein
LGEIKVSQHIHREFDVQARGSGPILRLGSKHLKHPRIIDQHIQS